MAADGTGADASATAAEPGAGARRDFPPFYTRPVLLEAGRHARLSLKEHGGFGFARGANALFVNVAEFAAAARHYPIVFTGGDAPVPAVILGVRVGSSLFVDEAGQWAAGYYVPAYARRYPFVFMESQDQSRLGLCIDEASDLLVESGLVESGGRPLFQAGRPTELVERALQFCTAFQRDFEATRAFGQALAEHGLLTPIRADLRLRSGERLALSGFRSIDDKRFGQLADDVVLACHKRGWLAAAHFQMLSTLNWSTLIDRAAGDRHG